MSDNDKVGKKAYSTYFHSWIICTKYISDTDWYFVLADHKVRMEMKAKAEYSHFSWE